MEKLLIVFIYTLFAEGIFSQEGDHINGGRFLKTIEYNRTGWIENGYNIENKEDVEQLFYGRYNAPVEFLYDPTVEYCNCYDGPSGFRLLMDSIKKSYILEVKYITNFKEAEEVAGMKYPLSGPPTSTFGSKPGEKPLTSDEKKLLEKQGKERFKNNKEERIRLYNVKGLSFAVSDQFAEKLYNKTVSFIDNFKAKGAIPLIFDGYSVSFRTVVGDELWSLNIHMPKGNAFKMATIYKQILEDAKKNIFEEDKYIRLLNDF
ncbi:hypothetical protein [Parabacteroides sp. Marseille-P3160]|uniref:hypothetical protein n=1 Tax=Parabacteroides sp. Marseille-P3160 TaxID=1917887 RepID=UPI0009B94B01|nr:hypothetical protein [Parabacteroides sp. Marseille-P3160]